jgi:CubicO group peptidase (beta-lactamase class C family)
MQTHKDDLQSLLGESLSRHRVPGASVAVFDNGGLTTVAAGMANLASGVEMTQDTVMHIGSITKVLNATLVMQLVDERVVDLEQPVRRYLEGFNVRDREALESISVKMLLNHTSGIDGELIPAYGCDHDEDLIEKAMEGLAQAGQIHRPGAEFSYCNGATVIAGYLVQRLRRRSWYRVIRERIFVPLGMEQAAALPEEALLHRASVGHFRDRVKGGPPVRTSRAFLPLSFAPCGTTLMLSARDLVTFARAHLERGVGTTGARILSTASVEAMQRMTVDTRELGYAEASAMGIGWMITDEDVLMHSGGGPGVAAVLYACPKRNFAAGVLTNAEHGWVLFNEVLAPVFHPFGIKKRFGELELHYPTEPPRVAVEKYVGVYENALVRHRVVQAEGGLALSTQAKYAYYDSISTEPTPAVPLIALGGDKFLLDMNDEYAVDAFRVVAFRDPNMRGQMRLLGNRRCLYARAA